MKLNELREKAASYGIDVAELDRFQLVTRIAEAEAAAGQQRQQETEAVEALRRQCAVKGLETHGDRAALELRLAAGVSAADRTLYIATGWLIVVLGVAGLLVSIPHISAALARLMGVSVWYAGLLAIIIDGGICGLKVVDTFKSKFDTNGIARLSAGLMLACLAFSAGLNASEFMLNATDTFSMVLAVTAAVFLSGFVFATFTIGSKMILRQAPVADAATPSEAFVQAARDYDRLSRLARKM